MSRVLVTGGTGLLGAQLVPLLAARGHDVRVLSRRAAPVVPKGVTTVRGDVTRRDDVDAAVVDVDAVIHAATRGMRPGARRTEVEGTRHVVAAAHATGAHVTYVSIVGVDRHRLPYYRAKWEAERVVAASDGPWAIQRATQFHELLAALLRGRALPTTRHLAVQPVAAADVSTRLVELVEQRAQGRVPDFGGPEVLPARDVMATWRRETGRRAFAVPLPALGPLRDFDAGMHLSPDHAAGTTTWAEWVARERT